MSNAGFGQGPKQETIYGGSNIKTSEGTVYNGPVGGTVYQGPAQTNGYSPSAQAPRMATPATGNAGARKGAGIFFVIAGFTALRTLLLFAGVQQLTLGANRMVAENPSMILIVNAVVIGIFVLLGVLTKRGSKAALLIGMLLYAADLVLLLLGNAGANVVYIVVHGLFLFYLFNAYRQFGD
jgi:hypothetical protein